MAEAEPKPKSPAFSTQWVPALALITGWGLFLVGFQRLATVKWVGASQAAGMGVMGICFLAAIAALGLLAKLKVRGRVLLAICGFWAATYVLLLVRLFSGIPFLWAAIYGVPLLNPFPRLLCQIVFNPFLFSVGATGGRLLSRLVEHPRYLVPVVVIISLADAWSLLGGGPTQALAESEIAPRIVAMSFPERGTGNLVPAVGITDVLFIGFFLTLSVRFGMSVWRGLLGIAAGLTAALAILAGGYHVPGLPFIGGGFIVMQWRRLKPEKRDLIVTAVFAVVMTAVMLTITLLKRSAG